MRNKKELCISCSMPLKKTYIDYKGLKLEARECIKCKRKIFTEDLAMKAISQLEAKRLESEYIKKPIKIGHSWGITFPKEVADVFNLKDNTTRIKIHPNVAKGIIEISLR
mgnify:CR=1 FL=1